MLLIKGGEYKMNIYTSPFSFDTIEYIKHKYNMKKLMEKIQIQLEKSKNEKKEKLL